MKKMGIIRAMTFVVASSLLVVTNSCVNQEYELSEDKLDLEMTVFQDGLSVPLGSTSKIMLKDLKDSLLAGVEDTTLLKYFTVGENGEYGVAVSGSMDLSDTLNNLLAQIEIPDVALSEKFSFSLNSVDVSDLSIDAAEYTYATALGSMVQVPDFPVIKPEPIAFKQSAGLYNYIPTDLTLEFPQVDENFDLAGLNEENVATLEAISKIYDSDKPLSIDQISSVGGISMDMDESFGTTQELSFSVDMPAGIKSVDEVVLSEKATICLRLELENSLFTSGTISPILTLNLSDLFDIEGASANGDVVVEFEIPASGKTLFETDLKIKSLNLYDENTGGLTLKKDAEISVGGTIAYSNMMTTINHLKSQGTKRMGINFEMEFVDFQIDDVKMSIETIPVEVPETTIELNQEITIPEQIEGVESITLSDDSNITLFVKSSNLPEGLDLLMSSLELQFPDVITVEGANEKGVLVYENVDLSKQFNPEIKILGINLPQKDNEGKIALNGVISVKAKVEAGGTVSSKALPSDEQNDLSVEVGVNAKLAINDYSVKISGFGYQMDDFSQKFEFDVTGMEQFGKITVVPQGEPEIVVDIMMPETGVQIVADPALVITFPKMLRFKELSQDYNYNEEAGTITLNGVLPPKIVLPLDCLVVSPEKNEETGKYMAGGEFKVSGGLAIPAGTLITKADISKFTSPDCVVGMTARIPEIKLGTLAMDEAYEMLIEKEFEVSMMSVDALPEQLVSIDRVEFDDVYFTMSLDASKLPDLGSTTLGLDFQVNLPDMIVMDSQNVSEDNVLTITGQLGEDGKVTVDPVKIVALDLSKIDFENLADLKETISITGKVVLDNIALDIEKWLGQTLEVGVDAGIRDIAISKVTGKVDLHVDPISTSVDLSSVSDLLNQGNLEITGVENLLSRLSLSADIETNVGVPMGAKMIITPYSDGSPVADSVWETELTLNHSQSAAEVMHTRYWISSLSEAADIYRPEGYTHIQLPLQQYLRDIPDSLNISIEAGTDPDKLCVIEPTQQYIVKAGYSAHIPFEFGDGASVTYRDTIPDLPEVVGQLLAMGDLVLTGSITNALPFEIDMKVNLLDSDGNKVPLDENASSQKIKGCGPAGEPVVTELYLGIQKKDGAEFKDVSAIEVEFKLATIGGVPLSDNCFVQASLQALIPNGVNVDVNELMNENEQ